MDYPEKIGTSWHENYWDRLNELIPDIGEDEMITAEKFANTCRYDDCALGRAECMAVETMAARSNIKKKEEPQEPGKWKE